MDSSRAILQKMLDRLFAALIGGPGMNCRPHSSRQRIDLTQLARLQDVPAEEVLRKLLGAERAVRVAGMVPRPRREFKKARGTNGGAGKTEPDAGNGNGAAEWTEEDRRAARLWSDQQTTFTKLRAIADDARTYEQDTGVHVLNIGFPLLALPPGSAGGRGGGGGGGFMTRRILAPIAFIPVTLEVKSGGTLAVDIACKGEGVDLVRPNVALLAWLQQQTGKPTPELFDDREAEKPWREIRELVAHVASAMGLQMPACFTDEAGLADTFALQAAPRADDDAATGEILPAAVIGLFPMANEGLLRDTQEMTQEPPTDGPVLSFLQVDVNLAAPQEAAEPDAAAKKLRVFADERLVTQADPCQSRAALLARQAAGLVIHGPPGTGKSQTITNIIGDHLARGQRVLMVCDKRTALDVVAHRLNHLGFGPLTALVHDPQRDQRELYKAIRERLENLSEARTRPAAAREIDRVDAELQQLHGELSAYWKSLMDAPPTPTAAGLSFHDAIGQWLALDDAVTGGLALDATALADVPLEQGRAQERLIREVLERGRTARWPQNPWTPAAGLALRDFLAHPVDHFRATLRRCIDAARQTHIAMELPLPPLGEGDLQAQADLRLDIAARLEKLTALPNHDAITRWCAADLPALRRATAAIDAQKPFIAAFRACVGALDGELRAVVAAQWPTVAQITAQLGKLNEYLITARAWHAFLQFKRKRLAGEVLVPLGLAVSADNAQRARTFLVNLRARLLVRQLLNDLGPALPDGLPDDETLAQTLAAHEQSLALLGELQTVDRAPLLAVVQDVLKQPASGPATIESLRRSAARARAVTTLESTLAQAGLFSADYLKSFATDIRTESSGGTDRPAAALEALLAALPTLEDILRAREALAAMPAGIRAAVVSLLAQSAATSEGLAACDRALLAAEISRRLRDDPWLQAMDAHRLQSTFDRYRQLDQQKLQLVREAALHHWISKQKDRLLASTQTRASTLGADLRRRLTIRGERALRLRQVIDVGGSIEGGDPLFDMCPVWMASPETVAQIFPRLPLFDVVIFDEASQCRLEEALPVLTRGKRVVIAGDPKQLPPTRFFESAVTVSQDDDADDQQSLFERAQGEVEDLLTAALNLAIENAYLDVHYRSRNADLIHFSNEQFYHHRLQAIPGHPDNTTGFSPLTLYRADGLYEDRQNEKEADLVCRIVRDLLKRAAPPSIGIACFNMVQRDLIVEKLDALAMEDAEFGQRLAAARTRQGAGSFEGLFVKNLENVQGDERDHIIISTTYGPQKDGKFYQRFGPLGRAGGGRRLNVLVTRARQEVHLVTSIPETVYRSLPPVPQGETPGGAWLLFAYLQFAERLAAHYAARRAERAGETGATPEAPAAGADGTPQGADLPPAHLPPLEAPDPQVLINPQQRSLPSVFSESLARRLAAGPRIGSTVHWGNDGFCVDLALTHPTRPDAVTIGILCDATRFRNAQDPVEWDLFRTLIHESQGWKLHRLWTPQFFRQPAEHLDTVLTRVRRHLAEERPPDALNVQPASE